MSISSSTDASRQRGEFLIEALVSLVLVAIVGLGTTYVASRISVAQRAQSVQNNALAQMRDILKTQQAADLCAGTIPNVVLGSTTITPTVTCSTSTVTLGSGAAAATVTSPQMVTLTLSGTAIASLIGGSGSLVVSN